MPSRAGKLLTRLAIAHVVAYPLALVAALAAIAPVILLREDALLAAPTVPQTPFQRWLVSELHVAAAEAPGVALVLVPTGLVAAAVFLWVHVAAVPWGRADADRHRTLRRRWLWASLGPVGAILVAGAIAWLWIALAQ